MSSPSPWAMVVLAWLIPGGAHLAMGQLRRGLVLLLALLALFVIGLSFRGQLLPLQAGEPLALLAAIAEWGLAGPHAVATVAGWGMGTAAAGTYEYGNTFLITGGLLNALAVLDAFDRATGRKPR